MMGSDVIASFQAKATARAARSKKAPLALFDAAAIEQDLRRAPNLGLHLAKGWHRLLDVADPKTDFERTCAKVVHVLPPRVLRGSRFWAGHVDGPWADLRLFIDKSGWGDSSEPALSADETIEALKLAVRALDGTGYALGIGLVEEGQFQCYAGLFLKESA